ncbi:MAG TPA: NAD(P)-dependent oxidoreductase [Mucilaginibacter sp.]
MQPKSSSTILITDSLFISKKNEKLLQQAGFQIERIDNPKLSESELCEAIKGKVGYILGGVEIVTKKVIDSADELKAIAFTGAGYTEFIPAYKEATKKGILISNAPGGNADAVAEFTIMLILMMTRNILSLGRIGKSSFKTSKSLKDSTVGVVGLGRVGFLVVSYLKALGVNDILYYSKVRKFHLEGGLGLEFVSKEDLLKRSQIITIHTSKDAGEEFISRSDINLISDGAIIINTAFPEVIDLNSLKEQLVSKRLFAAFDRPPNIDFSMIPPEQFFYSNSQTGFNTFEAIETVSDMATRSLINLLTKHGDAFCVNK